MSERLRLLDVNVLVALALPAHVHAEAAHRWLEHLPAGATWATCPLTHAAFTRLMLNPSVTGTPLPVTSVLATLAAISGLPGHRFVADPTSLANPAIDLIGLQGHRQVTDLHLVNLAASVGGVLATFDRRILDALAPADHRHVELIPPEAHD